MWYLGGKYRQSGAIVDAVALEAPDFEVYCEPFAGAMWSAVAMIRRFPDRRFYFSDKHPRLMEFWAAALAGWDPPERVSEEEYRFYKENRPDGDPMVGYVGFAWSFGGKFFGGAARTNRQIKGSYASTMRKIHVLRGADVHLACLDYSKVAVPAGSVFYLDPPYQLRTPQDKDNGGFDRLAFVEYAEAAATRARLVLSSEFINDAGWPVVHSWGDTVVRHRDGKSSDGTVELLMRVEHGRT